MGFVRKSYKKLPYAYFIGICLWVGLSGLMSGHFASVFILLFCTPFLYQWRAEKQGLDLILGIFLSFWAVLMVLAYLSDTAKLEQLTGNLVFLVAGGIITILNLIMAFGLIGKAISENNAATAA